MAESSKQGRGKYGRAPAARGRPRARQFGSRLEAVGPLDASNPLYLSHNKLYQYEYTSFVPVLGRTFLLTACAAIRSKLGSANRKSWMANYVSIFDFIVCALANFRRNAVTEKNVMVPELWKEFTPWLNEKLESRELKGGRQQTRHMFNRVFDLLQAREVIPLGTELPCERRLARMGKSKFTVKNWNHSEKSESVATTQFQYVQHGRLWSFDAYAQLGSSFIRDFIALLPHIPRTANPNEAPRVYQIVVDFLRFLSREKVAGRWSAFFKVLSYSTANSIEAANWQRLIYAWREEFRTRNREDGKGRRKITGVNNQLAKFAAVWGQLADKQVVPFVLMQRIPEVGAGRTSTPRRSLAQVWREDAMASSEVTSIWSQFSKDEQPAAREYISAMVKEIGEDLVAEMSATELAKSIVELNNKRLDELRRCAEGEFLRWWEHWKVGQAHIEASPIEEQELVRLLDSPRRTLAERKASVSELLLSKSNPHYIGNSLKYVLATQNGIATGLIGRYHGIMLMHESRYDFHAYLHPHKDATTALWVMLMVDSAANCEVVREMPAQCLRKTAKLGVMGVNFGGKARAGMKHIQDAFTIAPQSGIRLSCIQAIQAYLEMSTRYRAMVDAQKNCLLLTETRGQIKGPAAGTSLSRFKTFCSRHDELRGLPFLPSMIRTSALMKTFHSSPVNRSEGAKVQADHASVVTTHRYAAAHFPAQVMFDAQIHEFTSVWQAMVVATINSSAKKLGLTADQLQHLLSEGARTGLGPACLDPFAGVQPGTRKGQHCFRQDRCWSCKMRYLVGSVSHIVDMMLFHEHLTREFDRNKHNSTWVNKWLPWKVFTEVVLAKVRIGETAAAYLDAEKAVCERRAKYVPMALV